jgi:hypothetical protein
MTDREEFRERLKGEMEKWVEKFRVNFSNIYGAPRSILDHKDVDGMWRDMMKVGAVRNVVEESNGQLEPKDVAEVWKEVMDLLIVEEVLESDLKLALRSLSLMMAKWEK